MWIVSTVGWRRMITERGIEATGSASDWRKGSMRCWQWRPLCCRGNRLKVDVSGRPCLTITIHGLVSADSANVAVTWGTFFQIISILILPSLSNGFYILGNRFGLRGAPISTDSHPHPHHHHNLSSFHTPSLL